MAAGSGSYSISFAGQSLIKEDLLARPDPEFLEVVSVIRSSDFAFTGYEGTIRGSYGGWPMKSSFLHASDPLVLDCLKSIGFNLLSLSNNHAFDLGPNGILSTLQEVDARGFTHAGIGDTLAAASRPGVLRTGQGSIALIAMDAGPQGEHVYARDATERMSARPGSNRLRVHTTIGVPGSQLSALRELSRQLGHEESKAADKQVGFRQTPGTGFEFYGLRFEAADPPEQKRSVDPMDRDRIFSTVTEAASHADLVIVYVHHHQWEPRWERAPAWFQRFARECVDHGAGAVVSHGVPMLQGIEIYKGAPLLYALGNFIFHTFQPAQYTDERIWQSVVAKAYLSGRALERIELYPIVLGGEGALLSGHYEARRAPHLAHGAYGEKILRRFAELCEAFGTRVEIQDGRGLIRAAA